ncbi:MAG: 50S ribosomal protein L24 [Candidatus Ranarchaeia archaeon]
MTKKSYSSKPGKVRKRVYDAPQHKLRKHLTARLVDSLQDKHGLKRIPVRTGDSVLVVRGDFRDIEGKVESVDYKKRLIKVEGLDRKKADGTNVLANIPTSSVIITKLKTDKKRRINAGE